MKKAWKLCTVMGFLVTVLLTFSLSVVGNAYYDPDGTASEEFLFDAAECDRTVLLNCVDEEGTLIKQVYYRTKRGEDALLSFSLYGYDLVAFESDQGLWEKCKITWCTGVNSGTYLYVQLEYTFRSDLSRDVLTATVTVRKATPITVIQRHYLQRMGNQVNARQHRIEDSMTISSTISYYDNVSWHAQIPTGYHMADGYVDSFEGKFSYKWMGKSKNVPYDNFEYDWINTTWAEGMKSYNSFDESKDGPVDYCKDRVLYVDFYYDLDEYTLSFDANGGEGAPADMIKPYGFDIVIPAEQPTRQGYIFKGWSLSLEVLEVTYCAGDTYSENQSKTLYAVWELDDYEFSVSDLTVSEGEIFPSSVITVRVRADSWDQNDAYEEIPVDVYFNGRLLATERVDLDIYGVAHITFEINVGTVAGTYELAVEINREGIARELDQTNNCVCTEVVVKRDEYAFGVTALTGNAPYTEGVSVITSYLISNDSERSVRPEAETPVLFTVYYYGENGDQIPISSQTWEGLAIPYGGQNLVYFKWTVPDGLAGTQVFCTCEVNADGSLKENNRQNNIAILAATVAAKGSSQTENPTFTTNVPENYTPQAVPTERVGSASWTVWEYEDGEFVLKTYGIRLSEVCPEIMPDSNCSSATYNGDHWIMRSGYGITVSCSSAVIGLGGAELPKEDAYTEVQVARAYFLEYGYSKGEGEYRELVWHNGAWCFAENEDAENGGRIHYIPLWLADGEYAVSVVLTDIWTPVGQITAVRSSNVILIDGSLYDDWYN